MKLAIIADERQKEEILSSMPSNERDINWLNSVSELDQAADAIIHLGFKNQKEEIDSLSVLLPKPVIIHSVSYTIQMIGKPFIRINAWPGFLKGEIWEAAGTNEVNREKAEKVFGLLNKKVEWVADTPGFVAARIIAMIINEAYFALEEKISTKEEINTAMKTGTNYPYGPFEWADIIGLQNVAQLLLTLSSQHKKYYPSELLLKETGL